MSLSPSLADTVQPKLATILARATRRRAAGLYAGLTLLMLAPALIWPTPRTGDLVNHWARLTLLGSAPDDPLRAFYEVRWGAIPNLGVDLLYVALAPLLTAHDVARLSWTLAAALPALGAWRLHRVLFKTPHLGILLAPLLSYNLITTTGLVNVGMGVGLALLVVAWRLRLGDRVGWSGLLLLNLAGLAVLACHIIAFGMLALTLGLIEASPRAGEALTRGFSRGLASPRFVLAGVVAIPFMEPTPGGLAYAGHKWQALTAPIFGMSVTDLPLMEAMLIALAVALYAGQLSVAARMRWPLAALAGVVAVAPSTFGAGVLLDARLSVFTAYLALASLRWPWRGTAGALAPLLAFALASMRVVALGQEWAGYDAALNDARVAVAALPAGQRVLAIRPPAKLCAEPEMPFLGGLAALAVIDRHDFVNTLFALPGVQPVRPRDAALEYEPNMLWDASYLTPEGQRAFGHMAASDWAKALIDWRAHFDDVLLVHGHCEWRPDMPDLRPLGSSANVTVYGLRRP